MQDRERIVTYDQLQKMWFDLDRGWKAVILGFIVLFLVVAGVNIPW